jgi:hypothetical protein
MRIDLARRSKWNIGYFVAGFVYWSFATLVGMALPMESARVYWMIGGFTVFPMAIGFSRIMGSDPFTRGNPLGSLIGLAHGSLIGFLTPLLIVIFRDVPPVLPLAAAIFFGASFPVFFWAFGHPIFLGHIIVRVAGATAIWFIMPSYRYTVLPTFVALVYLVTMIPLASLRQRWLRTQGAV